MNLACCSKCYEKLAKNYPQAAQLWLDACACYIKHKGNFALMENRVPWAVPVFRRLESMGYISTCDKLDSVLVRVNGYRIIEENDGSYETFCIERDEHKCVMV